MDNVKYHIYWDETFADYKIVPNDTEMSIWHYTFVKGNFDTKEQAEKAITNDDLIGGGEYCMECEKEAKYSCNFH